MAQDSKSSRENEMLELKRKGHKMKGKARKVRAMQVSLKKKLNDKRRERRERRKEYWRGGN